MVRDEEKYFIEKLIEFHKSKGGTMSHDQRAEFIIFVPMNFSSLNIIFNKCIALDLIKYKLSDRTGWTVLTKNGWEFTTFKEFDGRLKSQSEIDKITIEKLQIELTNSRRQQKAFWPMTILAVVVGIIAVVGYINEKKQSIDLPQDLQIRLNTLDSVVNTLNKNRELDFLDSSKLVLDSLKIEKNISLDKN